MTTLRDGEAVHLLIEADDGLRGDLPLRVAKGRDYDSRGRVDKLQISYSQPPFDAFKAALWGAACEAGPHGVYVRMVTTYLRGDARVVRDKPRAVRSRRSVTWRAWRDYILTVETGVYRAYAWPMRVCVDDDPSEYGYVMKLFLAARAREFFRVLVEETYELKNHGGVTVRLAEVAPLTPPRDPRRPSLA